MMIHILSFLAGAWLGIGAALVVSAGRPQFLRQRGVHRLHVAGALVHPLERAEMSSNTNRALREARRAADILESKGLYKEANDVRSLCRSHVVLAETASGLYADNMALRKGTA